MFINSINNKKVTIMKKNFFYAALAIVLASCASDDFIGENNNSPNVPTDNQGITFGLGVKGTTRADIGGLEAAKLLGNHFYVTGTKGTEGTANPTETLVIDNYLVHFGANTAGTTESNTANWEYVGITPGTAPDANYVKLSSLNSQTIKYWDYSVPQYDFLAFSTGTLKAVANTSTANDEIGVTAMKYGAGLAGSATAYTFDIPTADAIKDVFISDITEVEKANYGKEVTLKFKSLGAKVRVALYETIPGYSVKDVVFYKLDGTTDFDDDDKDGKAKLISANANGLPTKGTIDVYFPHVGTKYQSGATDAKADYNMAAVTVTPVAASSVKTKDFGNLDNFAGKDGDEADADYLGRSLPAATFAGDVNAAYYQTVFPVSSSDPLTLRVDYTLVSTDGSEETINVYGAKAVVPATYTKWLPNYAYTYIFKISDNTNGWTTQTVDGTTPAGLFPITFDAFVAEATDATAEQTTITTVATPSITTYQQGHTYETNEYSKATGKSIYVQVMDNSAVPANLVTTLSDTNSHLYKVSDADATEAKVMDALEKRTTILTYTSVIGRNGLRLINNTNIDNAVTSIENGVDDNSIDVDAGSAAAIDITALTAGTYAYVYDYTSGTKTTVKEYQPVAVTAGSAIDGTGNDKVYYTLTTATLDAITEITTENEAVDNDYIYFSKTNKTTTDGGATYTYTYSYISVTGKDTLPAGLIKVAKSTLTTSVAGSTVAAAGTFYFDMYITNDGLYAVKVIKIVA
jgi:hypothetical protein